MWWQKKKKTNSTWIALGTAGAGALTMFLLDPRGGGGRRGWIKTKVVGGVSATGRGINTAARDLGNRSWGTVSTVGSLFRREGEVSDEKLEARVRSKIGRVVSHPHAINVTANDGTITLSGPILTHEVPALIAAANKVKGVTEVRNELETHDEPGTVPALQGEGRLTHSRLNPLRWNTSPTGRIITGAVGAGLATYGLAVRRDEWGIGLGVLGGLLVTKAITNFGAGSRGTSSELRAEFWDRDDNAIDVQESIEINAPVAQVYQFWHNFENFPRFMDNLKEVRPQGNGRSHWVAKGPAGVNAEWDAVIRKDEENRLITWESLPNSHVDTAGTVHFKQKGKNRTELRVQMVYMPPAGSVGDAVAKLFGSSPKTMITESLQKAKNLLESGEGTTDYTGTPGTAETRPPTGQVSPPTI